LAAARAVPSAVRSEGGGVPQKDLFTQTSLPYLEVRRPFIIGTAEGRCAKRLGVGAGGAACYPALPCAAPCRIPLRSKL
jgi:hypothetical protein